MKTPDKTIHRSQDCWRDVLVDVVLSGPSAARGATWSALPDGVRAERG